MKKTCFLLFAITISINAQEPRKMTLPYSEIPEAQPAYSPGNIIARYIDGLGYRYYWATEGLNENDLGYRISKDSRTVMETLEHIHGLSESILNVPEKRPNKRPYVIKELSFTDLRKETLNNLMKAANLFQKKEGMDIEELKVVFEKEGNQSTFPFWNLINGQLSDAMYHVGQVVANRRASGNPINPKVNVFIGKTGK